MNIAIVTPEMPYPDNTGGRKYTWERIKTLYKNNNKIFLYSVNDEEICLRDEPEMKKYCEEINLYKRNNNLIRFIFNIYKPYSAYSRYIKELQNKLENDINNNKIDILIIDIPQMIYNIPTKCNIPIVLTQHNIEYNTFFNIAQKTKSILKKILFYFEGYKLKVFEESFYKRDIAGLYTFISSKDKEFFEKTYNKTKTLLLPMGMDISNSILNIKKSENKIVFVGKMSYYPNEEAAMWFSYEVLPLIRNQIKDIKFYLVGKDPSTKLLELGNNRDVVVTGTVESVEKYIDDADIVVIPLLSGGGVKIKLLEALSRNKIVIATSKGIEGTDFVNGKHLLVADNNEDFATKCISVLKDPQKYRQLPINSQKLIYLRYSWDEIGKKYSDILNKLIKNFNNNLKGSEYF